MTIGTLPLRHSDGSWTVKTSSSFSSPHAAQRSEVHGGRRIVERNAHWRTQAQRDAAPADPSLALEPLRALGFSVSRD